MPATIKVKICEAKHLPVMDRSGETTDAFVEVRLANNIFKTDVCRRTLHPKWEDGEWFRFEVNDVELQEEPLQIRVMDYDTYSSHDAIGKVYVDLTNMLMSENRSVFSGWLPIYDTLLGIRGQLKLEIRLIPFCVDMKTFWHFSYNVLFFSSTLFPTGFRVKRIIGLVDHSLVAEDPEHQWIDKIRTPRTTNEARQVLFMKMSGELRRKIGNKVIEMGGNAVVALRQRIDLGHIGVILRAIGTAVIVEKLGTGQDFNDGAAISPGGNRKISARLETVPGSPVDNIAIPPLRVDDVYSVDGENSPTNLSEIGQLETKRTAKFFLGNSAESEPVETAHPVVPAEFPFLTVKHLPTGIIKSLGGMVSCKMIKTLERLEQDDINQAPYALWWKELRTEVLRHMKCVGCNAVIGYSEELRLTDSGNIQILCGSGSAAVLDVELSWKDHDGENLDPTWNINLLRQNLRKESSVLQYPEMVGLPIDCKMYHLPMGEYSDHAGPTSASCSVCRNGHVPDILFTTIEPPDGTPLKGMGTLIQARVQRKTKALKGETGARELSECLPFIEFDLHSQINTKLKLLGLNVVFNLKIDIQCGTEIVVACATGTGVCVMALPRPLRPTVLETNTGSDTTDLQTKLDAVVEQHLRQLGLVDEKDELKPGKVGRAPRSNVKKKKSSGLRQFSKSGFVVDLEDERSQGRDILSLLDFVPPKDTLIHTTEICPMHDSFRKQRSTEYQLLTSGRNSGVLVQNFSRMWRTPMTNDQDELGDLSATCQHMIKDIIFRTRMYRPCRVSALDFQFHINSNDELFMLIQGSIVGEPLPLYTYSKSLAERRTMRNVSSRAGLSESDNSSDVPAIRVLSDSAEAPTFETSSPKETPVFSGLLISRLAASGSSRSRISPPRPSQMFLQNQIATHSQSYSHVEISALSFVHSGTVKRYVGNLNMVVLRECQALRDNDGLSGFMQRALADFYAMIRSQTLASGGNYVLSFHIAQLQLADSYNQAQCIIHATGDMVEVEDTNIASIES